MHRINNVEMTDLISIGIVDRIDRELGLDVMRTKLNAAEDQRRRWAEYAMVLETQLRREGWTQADLDDLGVPRPE